MLRTIILSVLMFATIGAMFPLDESTAHGLRQSFVAKRHHRPHYRRHSRAWWRRYRARLRRKRALAATLAAHRRATLTPAITKPTVTGAVPKATTTPRLPTGWNNMAVPNSTEMRFRTETGNVTLPGQAALTVVAQSRPTPAYFNTREANRLLAGVAVADLRRIVIDKMLKANGWVTNDFQRQINGYRVFIVTAQTPADARSPEKSWNFYFTEINGRIYSLTTNTPREFSDRMAAEAETFITSLHVSANTTQPSQK